MKKKSLTLFLICFTTFCYSQVDSLCYKNKILIKWAPSSLIDIYSALQFSGEFYYNSKHSVQVEYGFMFPAIALRNNNNKGHRIRIEHRNYFSKKETWYLASEVHFAYVQYDDKKRFSNNWKIDSISGDKYPLDSYLTTVGIKKLIASANCKIGLQYIFNKPKIVLDFYCGIGIRYVNTTFVSYPSTGEYVAPIDNWLEPPFKEGNRIVPNAVTGIKIGYQIR
jgi:hypothetical protein